MKQLLLVALLSAFASSALTLIFSSAFRPAAPGAGTPGMTAAEFKGALGDLEREVAALRREIGGGAADREAGAAVHPAPAAPLPGPAPLAAPPVVRDGASLEPLPPPEGLLRRFLDNLPRDEAGHVDQEGRKAMRRKWMFRAEREVFEWFGMPAIVAPEGELETWYYEVPTGVTSEDGTPEYRSFWIRLNRGRFVDMGD